MPDRIYTCKALTDIWTGDAEGKPDRLITTGLLGSIRWWFEVLVRGLGGSACDPTSDHRCPDHGVKDPKQPKHHCVVCELFGCTGWARKFRFEVLDENDNVKASQITKDETFKLRFFEVRPIRNEEWGLLDLTLRLIADYGAIGGKTVYKPTEEHYRQLQQHHQDFGLIWIDPAFPAPPMETEQGILQYIALSSWRTVSHADFAWASLPYFWCVPGKYLSREDADRSSFNRVIGRHESKKCRDCGKVHDPPQKCPKTRKHPRRHSDQNPATEIEKWLAGQQQESKKVFSFKEPARTFGFVRSKHELHDMQKRLKEKAWKDLKDEEFRTFNTILDNLLS